MKTLTITFAQKDERVAKWMCEYLNVSAHYHVLARKILQRHYTFSGTVIAFSPNWIDVAQLKDFKYSFPKPEGEEVYAKGDSPLDKAVSFVSDSVTTGRCRILACANFGGKRRKQDYWTWCPTMPLASYGKDEVYHLFTPENADPDVIEAAIADSQPYWGVCVCSSYTCCLPERLEEAFFDEVVAHATDVLMPIFDGDGFLIWSIK